MILTFYLIDVNIGMLSMAYHPQLSLGLRTCLRSCSTLELFIKPPCKYEPALFEDEQIRCP